MKLVEHLFRRFIPVFFTALFLFILILQLVDLLMHLWNYINNQVAPEKIMELIFLYTPKAVSFSLPLAVLFASAYCLSMMYAQNELIIIFTSGIPLYKFVLPLLIFSFLLSFALFAFEDAVVVPTYAQKRTLQKQLLRETVNASNQNVAVQAEEGRIVYKADYYDDINKRLINLTVVERTADFSLKRIVVSRSAAWQNDRWAISDSIIYEYDGTSLIIAAPETLPADYLTEPPETFKNTEVSVEEINIADSKVYLQYLKRTGLPSAEAESLYYKKFAFPFVLFIVVFLSAGLSGKTRKNVLPVSLVLSVCAAVLFYITQMVTMLLAKFGYISPFAGAWIPVVFFVGLSAVLLKFSAT